MFNLSEFARIRFGFQSNSHEVQTWMEALKRLFNYEIGLKMIWF